MLNIIKADLYRLIRSKGIYITFGLLLAMIALIVGSAQDVNLGVRMEALEGSLGRVSDTLVYNGLNIAAVLYGNMDNLAYFLLPLSILSSAPMFSHGTVKNSLACGTSRLTLYLSKLLLSSALCVLMVVFYMGSGIFIATVLRGFGGSAGADYWFNILKICGSQLFLLLALNSFAMFIIFTTKLTAMVTGIYIAFCIVPAIVLVILASVNEKFIELYQYDLLGNIQKLAHLSILPGKEIAIAFIVGAVYLLLTAGAGFLLFRKCEIK